MYVVTNLHEYVLGKPIILKIIKFVILWQIFIGGRNTTGPILKAETGYVSNISYIQTTKYIRIIIILHNNWNTPFEVIITSVDVWTFYLLGMSVCRPFERATVIALDMMAILG